jgi:poly-beta-1,6-N-acetyl-D-glucosamine synthase
MQISQRPRYIVISPVKNEERYIAKTLESMVKQTFLPSVWIIVDDGSTDRTAEVVQHYSQAHSFIRLLRLEHTNCRATGTAEVRAFKAGLEAVRGLPYDFVVKFDGDLSFEPDYFERLLAYFANDPHLGIASGVYRERFGTSWEVVPMPPYHASGASKVVRRECFEEIGGFLEQRGWDTVDEIRSMARGWKTTHFCDLQMKHWKPEGTGMGWLKTNFMHGEIHYRTGGGLLFFLLKAAHRITCRPYALGALALLWGYLTTMFQRTPLLITSEESRCYRALLNDRILGRLKALRPSRTT